MVRQWAHHVLLTGLLVFLAACGSLPERPAVRESSTAIPASNATALGRITAQFPEDKELSGFRALPQSVFDLDARLELIKRAQSSLDLQYYLLGNDKTGRLILRSLRDAAQRGVRVRLLLDDLYTADLEPLLLGLASYPNVEIRLFNPFTFAHGNPLLRNLNFMSDFKRLNHRMHNKLFVADGAMAVVGGRNLADEYFVRSREANFVDFDVLATGPLVRKLSQIFDIYWSSDQVFPLASVVPTPDSPQALRQRFDAAVRPELAPLPRDVPEADIYGNPPLGVEIDRGQFHFVTAWANAYADPPAKADSARVLTDARALLIRRYVEQIMATRSEILMVSPYLIPGRMGMEHMRELREHGVAVRIVTNALTGNDELVVDSSYRHYRVPMLRLGVELYELSPEEIRRSKLFRSTFGSSRGGLHAKVTLIDRETVLMGSMNLDQRSAYLNTELGVMIRSAEMARKALVEFNFDKIEGVYRVELKPDGTGLRWIGTGDDAGKVLDSEPGDSLLMRLRLWLDEQLISEDML